MSDYECGPIRFVGGSKHNEIIAVQFLPVIQFPVCGPVPVVDWCANWVASFEEMPELSYKIEAYKLEAYKLVEMRLGTGCRFWEYHSTERLASDGFTECEKSGANGSMHP